MVSAGFFAGAVLSGVAGAYMRGMELAPAFAALLLFALFSK